MQGQTRQSTVDSVEVGNSIDQRCALPQTRDTFGLDIILTIRVRQEAKTGICNIWKPDRVSES